MKLGFGAAGAEILSVEQMYRADAAAIAAGIPSEELMENAGRAVVEAICGRWAPQPVLILCGPGNNGGDGFVIARLLAARGWPVTVALLGNREYLSGDAALNAGRWDGDIRPLGLDILDGAGLVVDALFGAGLARDLDGVARGVIVAVNERNLPCVGVDIPSGIHGDTGTVMGTASRCLLTVTFCRRKPGHLLMPGRAHCGETLVADIGISDSVVAEIGPVALVNGPAVWQSGYPWRKLGDHKYSRGHVLVAGGASMTGAARLASRAAARIGAGMVTIASPPEAVAVYAADWPGFLVTEVADAVAFAKLFEDARKNAALIGPGGGIGAITRENVLTALGSGRATVLDADALTVFEESPGMLFDAIKEGPVVLTPHEGEFGRLFDTAGDKISRCRAAANRSGAVVLLKGADTVIAAPDGRVVVNDNAPPDLATAGAGDVLAGFVVGLLAQGANSFDAACAAAWLHGAAATAFGPGLVAGDLPDCLPNLLKKFEKLSSWRGCLSAVLFGAGESAGSLGTTQKSYSGQRLDSLCFT